jgi:serine/threonine-protein kinase
MEGKRLVALTPGFRLGPYEITARIGVGGMGEVHRARDTKLGRDVAIKVLPDAVGNDPDRLLRFGREARTLAALNHPHIAAIYGLEEADGVKALVMELVEGPTLADRLEQGAIPVIEAVRIARQVAAALEAAHEQGIVHRDLKPASVKVRNDGTVKVLDFGLAKAIDARPEGRAYDAPGLSQSPTITRPAVTEAGMILGTAAYMSPEQARGDPVGKGTDIWAFGCVLFEMLTGRRAFEGDRTADVMARVLTGTPDWTRLPADTPGGVRRVLRRCLEKDARRRLRDIADAALELEADDGAPATTAATDKTRVPVTRLALVGTALIAPIALGLGWWLGSVRSPTSSPPVSRYVIDLRPADALIGASPVERTSYGRSRPSRTAVAVSPDGRTLAFTASRDGQASLLYMRSLDRADAVAIEGTEGADGPFFSPDGRWIGFWASGSVSRVSVDAGLPVVVGKTGMPTGAMWLKDDRIVFSQLNTIWAVPASGGEATQLTTLPEDGGELAHMHPHVLPGGGWLVYSVLPTVLGWDRALVVAQSLESGERRTLLEGAADARYVPTRHLVYLRLGTLMARPFDAATATFTGAEVSVAGRVLQSVNAGGTTIDTGSGQYAFSASGTLAYVAGEPHPDFIGTLQWIARDGSVETIPTSPRPYFAPKLSPDGRAIVVGTLSLSSQDLWRYDLADHTVTRLTTTGRATQAIWSPDGSRLAFNFTEGGQRNLFEMSAEGGEMPRRLATARGTRWRASSRRMAAPWCSGVEATCRSCRWTLSHVCSPFLPRPSTRVRRISLLTGAGSRTCLTKPASLRSTCRHFRTWAASGASQSMGARSRPGRETVASWCIWNVEPRLTASVSG